MPETASRTNLYIDGWMDISNGNFFSLWIFFFFFFVLFLPRTFSFWKKEKIPCADFILTSTWRSRKPTNLQVFESFSLRPFFGSRDQDSVLGNRFRLRSFFIHLFIFFVFQRETSWIDKLDTLIFFFVLIHISD